MMNNKLRTQMKTDNSLHVKCAKNKLHTDKNLQYVATTDNQLDTLTHMHIKVAMAGLC